MTSNLPNLPQPSGSDPISDAAYKIAANIHEGFLSELYGGSSAAEVAAAQGERYPAMLFGELAMHVADVQLPPDASTADRASGVSEALRRIISTPSLFEAVTGAPLDHDRAISLRSGFDMMTIRTQEESVVAHELQAAIVRNGGLSQEIIPGGRAVQLYYAGSQAAKRLVGREAAPQEVMLKVAPAAPLHWTVHRYGRISYAINDFVESFGRPQGERELVQPDVFTLLAAESSGLAKRQTKELNELVGATVGLGKVSTGTMLVIENDFYAPSRETHGIVAEVSSQALRIPVQLQQAYLGNSRDLPLF